MAMDFGRRERSCSTGCFVLSESGKRSGMPLYRVNNDEKIQMQKQFPIKLKK
jgi:hypothetical protein